ncbi:MAG: hypothetical protein LBK22_04985, partial [Tannerella sp.]|nr:hypothetical protein [Tannerella sp.]
MARKMKAWLKKNPLTPEANDYFVVIESYGSVNPAEIIDGLKADGMELKPETVLDVVTRFNNKCIDLVLSGHNVSTGLVYMKAAVRGVAYDRTWD